ncbi:Sorting Nexin-31 [Manis pentadactyla]|nr:Sorting Nexin-31 [Manis pentadactyla]
MRGILDTCSNSAFPICLCPLDPDSPETKMAEQFQDSYEKLPNWDWIMYSKATFLSVQKNGSGLAKKFASQTRRLQGENKEASVRTREQAKATRRGGARDTRSGSGKYSILEEEKEEEEEEEEEKKEEAADDSDDTSCWGIKKWAC